MTERLTSDTQPGFSSKEATEDLEKPETDIQMKEDTSSVLPETDLSQSETTIEDTTQVRAQLESLYDITPQQEKAYSLLIWSIIWKYFSGYDYDTKQDLFGEGWRAVLMAYKDFDPNRGAHFTTYAHKTIYGYLKHWERDKIYPVHQSRNTNIPPPAISNEPGVLSGLTDNREQPDTFLNRPHDLIAHIRTLPAREAEVIKLHHGLNGEEPMTTSQIAGLIGRSQQNVSQVYRQGIRKLKLIFGIEESPPFLHLAPLETKILSFIQTLDGELPHSHVLIRETGASPATLSNAFRKFLALGLIRKIAYGKYELIPPNQSETDTD